MTTIQSNSDNIKQNQYEERQILESVERACIDIWLRLQD